MGIFGTIWKSLKGAGKWAVKNPEAVKTITEAGVSIYDARKRGKSTVPGGDRDYTLSNLNERIRQLQEHMAEEISAVRSDIHRVSDDLQQDYVARIIALSMETEDIRIAQEHQAKALKRMMILYGCLLGALTAATVVLFLL